MVKVLVSPGRNLEPFIAVHAPIPPTINHKNFLGFPGPGAPENSYVPTVHKTSTKDGHLYRKVLMSLGSQTKCYAEA